MSPNILKDLLDTTTITISCPIICHLVTTYIVSTISSPIISHLVTTYIVCINGKCKIQLDFLFGDNISVWGTLYSSLLDPLEDPQMHK